MSRTCGSASLRSFRLVCRPEQVPLVEDLLRAQGFVFEDEPFSPLARRLIHEPLPLGSSFAAAFGYIYIQNRSSMLPPLALNPPRGASVLDMCASPGGKTGFLGQLVGPAGFILGNEPTKTRLATLRRNLQLLNLFCCCTASHPGEKLPLASGSWECIQLDPPCSGWGTAEKNPRVMRLWQGNKIAPLLALQRRLLTEAARLLAPGGRLVYSTCTTNVEENEDQLRYAREELGLVLAPLAPPPGFAFAGPARPGYDGVLRVNTGKDGQGFFVALLLKPAALAADGSAAAAAGTGAVADEPPPDAGSAPLPFPQSAPPGSLKQRFSERPRAKERRFADKRRGSPARNAFEEARMEILPASVLDTAYADPGLLPPGSLAVFNGVVHFLPEPSGALLPDRMAWKGFPLGRTGRQGGLRLAPHLHSLMPDAQAAEQRGLAVIALDTTRPLFSLFQGRGLSVNSGCAEAGLYYRNLPLCRLSVKGGRAILPPL